MSKDQEIKQQRDRFLAFAFASADLFIEVSETGKVTFALGAAKGMTGVEDPSELVGKNWLEIFSTYDQAQLNALFENAKAGKRVGPLLVDLNELITKRKGVFTGIKMPGSTKFWITLGLSNLSMARIAGGGNANPGQLFDRTSFLENAKDTLEFAKSVGQDIDMTVFDFSPSEEDKARMGEENWNNLTASIAAFLQSQSIDGAAAAQIDQGKYSVIHDQEIDGEFLRERMEKIALDNDPSGDGIDIKSKTIDSDLSELSERDAAKALIYTINEFERKGTNLSIDNLNNGLKQYAEANAERLKEFQSLIERLDFKLHFQPIVDLETLEISHYEMLSRFNDGDTLEWIMFGEDMGMASKFDMAVCELALNTITRKFATSRTKFSVNLSGQSFDDPKFVNGLLDLLSKADGLNERLMFELTESTHIKDLKVANEGIEKLQEAGFKIALDDFGAGAASFQYLQALSIDMVKIDGKYIRKLLYSSRDASMIKNLVNMCRDLNIDVVAEFVEQRSQADILKEMGVQFAQGYLFGIPSAAPEYQPPSN